MPLFKVDWRPAAIEDVRALFEYLAENASLWDAEHVTDRVLRSSDKLAEFPRLYEADPRYGEGIRRISVVGQNILYEVDDAQQVVKILAVVGQRQNTALIR
jgi:plasmid stabilization system protein ParE